MPNTPSAKKRLKQDTIRRERNRSTKRTIRTQCRKVLEAVAAGNAEQAQTELKAAAQKLDRAAAQKVIHRNAAVRTKLRLAARVKTAKKK